jgi:hypothetical protein
VTIAFFARWTIRGWPKSLPGQASGFRFIREPRRGFSPSAFFRDRFGSSLCSRGGIRIRRFSPSSRSRAISASSPPSGSPVMTNPESDSDRTKAQISALRKAQMYVGRFLFEWAIAESSLNKVVEKIFKLGDYVLNKPRHRNG